MAQEAVEGANGVAPMQVVCAVKKRIQGRP
jgi:hypothetical protein